MVDEAHVTTFAVHPDYRRRRIGERLLLSLLDLAVDRRRPRGHARGPAVEPRRRAACTRSTASGPSALRPRYYSDDNEDALIMTTEPLAEPAMRDRVARLRAALDAAAADAARRRRAERRRRRPAPEDDPA